MTLDQNSQPPINPNDAAASLAMATHISNQLATPQGVPQTPSAPPAPQEPSQEVQSLTQEVEMLSTKLDQLQKQVDKEPQQDIAEMRQMIEQALAEDDTTDNGK